MKPKTTELLVYAIFGLTVSSCMASIRFNEIYQDSAWANAQWLGQDLVSLFVAAPLLLVAYFKSLKSWKWKMVLAGASFYFVYTYAFYTIVAKLNFLYFFHLAIFGSAIFLLFIVLLQLFKSRKPFQPSYLWLKWSSISFLLINSSMLSFLWILEVLSHYFISDYQSDTPNGEPAMIIYTLDLSIVVPLMLAAAYGYWKNRNYGYVLTGIMLTKTALIGFALMAMALNMYFQEISLEVFLVYLWCFIGCLGTVLTISYIRSIRQL